MKNNPFYKYLTKEDHLQKAIINYLNIKKLTWIHVPNEGRRTPFECFKAAWLGIKSGPSDLIVFNSSKSGKYKGLVLECKTESPYNKNGTLKKNSTIERQNEFINKMIELGYAGGFVWSIDMAIMMIDSHCNY